MSDVNLIDIDALNNLKDEFEKQIKEISSSTLNTFQNSYLTQSNDLYVKQMANRIKKGLEGISTSGNNISSWLTNYLNDVQGLDKALSTDQKSAPISSSSVLSYLKTLPFLGEIDLSKLSFNSINSKKEISSINNNTNSNGNITGKTSLNSSSKAKEEVKETLTSVQNKQQEVIDINKIKNISQEAIAEIGQAFTEFVITSDENLPKAAEGLTNMMKNAGLLTASSAKVVNDTVTAYVSEGVKASIQGAATFAANFDYQKVAQGYTQATTVLAEEGSKGAQAGLQAGLSNFNAEPIVQSGVTAFNQISSAVSAGNTDVSTYLNPMANVATETLNQTIPAVQAGATEFAKNFNAEKVVNGYVNATINAAEITSRAASLGINSSLSSVDVNRLDDANKRAMDTLGLACAETYANFMDGFKETIDSLDSDDITVDSDEIELSSALLLVDEEDEFAHQNTSSGRLAAMAARSRG